MQAAAYEMETATFVIAIQLNVNRRYAEKSRTKPKIEIYLK